jgi:uncharacterized protein (TIGR02246 family)
MVVTRWLGAIAVAAVIFAGGYVSGESSQQPAAVEDEVRSVLDRYMAARNTFNSDAFLDFFVKSPQLTYISATSEYIGWDALRKGIAPVFDGHASTVEVSDVRVFEVNRNLAVVHHHSTFKTAKGDANPSRTTKVFVRTAEGWKVVAEHSSRIPDFRGGDNEKWD